MRLAAAFGVGVLLMLAFVIAGDQFVGLTPPTPTMSSADRTSHLWLVAVAASIVITVDALFVWLALRHPPAEDGGSE